MTIKNRHIGFHQEAPKEVIWSQSSYIKSVNSLDERSIAHTYLFVSCGFFGMIVLSGVLLALSKSLSDSIPVLNSAILVTICMSLMLSAILIGLFREYFLKRSMINKLRSRSQLLFEPGWDCIFVGIEDVFTYDKMKLIADDFGLIKITDDSVLLEMTKYRARFQLTDLQASLLHTGKNLVAVRLSCNQKPYQWSVAITPLALSRNIFKYSKPITKARWLLDILTKAGIVTEQQTSQRVETALEQTANLSEEKKTISQEPNIATDAIKHKDLMEDRYQNVLKEIQKKQKKKKGSLKNIAILLITLLLFFHLGFFHWGFKNVVLILAVLVVHELGHFLSMKLLGYKNVQMFFIPLMGAAVSGTSRNVATWKKAIVTLSGPLPGIVISLILFIVYIKTAQEILLNMGLMFLLINTFNLLPIVPLDGGRFLHEVLFSRNPYIELVTNILAAAIFLIAGFSLNSWILKILGILNLVTIRYKFKLTSLAKRIQRDLMKKKESDMGISFEKLSEEDIPEGLLKQMLNWIYQNMPGPMKPKTVAATALEIWDRIRVSPPKWYITIALIFLFSMGYVVSFISLGAFAFSYYRDFKYKSKIAKYHDANGTIHYKEQWFYLGKLDMETQLSDDQQFYHGYHKAYYFNGELAVLGQWNMGWRTGQWRYYDPNSLLVKEEFYEDGKPTIIRRLEEGQWTAYKWEDFADWEKEYYEQEVQIQQGPDKNADIDLFEFPQDNNDVSEPCSATLP